MNGENNTIRGQFRGYVFEVIIRLFLEQNGWNVISNSSPESVKYTSDYDVQLRGRGTWHQIDAPCEFSGMIPFVYPLRLLVEAKFYSHEIQKNKIREFIGTVKDISENYFVDPSQPSSSHMRFTDIGAYFAANGFQDEAVHLAFAHGMKVISYRNNVIMNHIKEAIIELEINTNCSVAISRGNRTQFMLDLWETLRYHLAGNLESVLTQTAINILQDLRNEVLKVNTNFFGMTRTGILIHFLSVDMFPIELFSDTDVQLCRVHFERTSRGIATWLTFTYDETRRRFYFEVPTPLEEVILNGGDVRNEKSRMFEHVSVTYTIHGILRTLTLQIDKDWLYELNEMRMVKSS